MYDKTFLPKSHEFCSFTRLWHYSSKAPTVMYENIWGVPKDPHGLKRVNPNIVINHTKTSSFIYKGNQFSMTSIFSIVRFILITGRNMNEDNSYLMSPYLCPSMILYSQNTASVGMQIRSFNSMLEASLKYLHSIMYDKTFLPKSHEFCSFTRFWHYSSKAPIVMY